MSDLFQIKICGITSPIDAESAILCGADAIGLNFYPASSRFVAKDVGAEICDCADRFSSSLQRKIWKVGVFVNSGCPEIVANVLECGLDAVQLHGDEPATLVEELRGQLQVSGQNETRIIRAVRTSGIASNEEGRGEVNQEIEEWVAAGVDAVLLDACAPGLYGGTGNVVDWDSVKDLNSSLAGQLGNSVSLILAGGLTPENVTEAIRRSGTDSVDVASGVESSPGIKDPVKLQAFIGSAKSVLCGLK